MDSSRQFEVAWAAGFIEGEGNIRFDRYSLAVRVAQVDPAPLCRLVELWGGKMDLKEPDDPRHQPTWYWACAAGTVRQCLTEIIPFLSGRKLQHALVALGQRDLMDERNRWRKEHHPCGHQRSLMTTYVAPNGSQHCRPCSREYAKRRRAKI
jgi:hypothetical protein